MTIKKSSLKSKTSSKSSDKKITFDPHVTEKRFVRRGSVSEQDIRGLDKSDPLNTGVLSSVKKLQLKPEGPKTKINIDSELDSEEKIPQRPRRNFYFKHRYDTLGLPNMFYDLWFNNFPNSKNFEREMYEKQMFYVGKENFYNKDKDEYLIWLLNNNMHPSSVMGNIKNWEERNVKLFDNYNEWWKEYSKAGNIKLNGFERFIEGKNLDVVPKRGDIEPLVFFGYLEVIYAYWEEYIKHDHVIDSMNKNVNISRIIEQFKYWILSIYKDMNLKDIFKEMQYELRYLVRQTMDRLKKEKTERQLREFSTFYNTFLESQKKTKKNVSDNNVDKAYMRFITRK